MLKKHRYVPVVEENFLGSVDPVNGYHSSFHLNESPHSDVKYNYAGKQSIPATGLSPVRHAALWAASKDAKDAK